MKAAVLRNAFGLENLHLEERPQSDPGPGEVRIRLKAASLNFRDHLMIHGRYNPRQKLPLVPLSDGAGIVEAAGPGVEEWKENDRVCPLFAQRWFDGQPDADTLKYSLGGPLDGTLRESMIVPAQALVRIPEHLSFEEASTLPCAALTAWSALFTMGNLRAGQAVAVLGTGGVSMFAMQFAKISGARAIVTSSDDEKLEKARTMGADALINYQKNPAWEKEIRTLTGGTGADHIIETGGAGTLEKSIRAVRHGGIISLIGVLAGGSKEMDLTPVFMRNIKVQGVLVGHRQSFLDMNRAIDAAKLRPVIDRVFGLEECGEALRHLASGRHFGKVVLKI